MPEERSSPKLAKKKKPQTAVKAKNIPMKGLRSGTLKSTGDSSSDSDDEYSEIKVENDAENDVEVAMDVDELNKADPLKTEPSDEATIPEEYSCGACGVRIEGVRYACVQCENHDVCDACCSLGVHGHHYLLRVPLARPPMETHEVIECVRLVVQEHLPLEVLQQEDKELETEVKAEPDDGDPGWTLEWEDETAKEAAFSESDEAEDPPKRSLLAPASCQRKRKEANSMATKSKRSQQQYEIAYKQFAQWKSGRKLKSLSESVFLAYFSHLSKTKKPTTLWTFYSMLNSMVLQKHNVDMSNYHNLKRMLKNKSDGYTCKRSQVLTEQHFKKFINEAPDSTYLDAKVILIFGIYGACRSSELANIKVNDIETMNHVMMVTLHDTQKGTKRTFVVPDSALAVVRKYQALRPADAETDRFFLNYKNGKCTKQVIGRNKFAKVPSIIATYLNLPNPKQFTGCCFRQSAAALVAKTSKVSGKVDDEEESKDSDSCGRGQPTEWDSQTTKETTASAESDEAEDNPDEVEEEDSLLSHQSTQKEAKPMTKSSRSHIKSREKYNVAYKNFVRWKSGKKLNSLSENVFLAYFSHLSKTMLPSSLWCTRSMLKSMVWQKHNVDIENYHSVRLMLKKKSDGYKSKQSKVLTEYDVEKFINEAPDSKYLDAKVILIFGIYGACRCTEIINITVNDIETHSDVIMVTIREIKAMEKRTFVIRGTALAVVKKYQALRPALAKTNRFFLRYERGKCAKGRVIGRCKIEAVPKVVATYLKLPSPEEYTGYCFRRTAASLFAKSGPTVTTHGGGMITDHTRKSAIFKPTSSEEAHNAGRDRPTDIKLVPLCGDASWGDQPSLGQTAHEATASAESDEAGGHEAAEKGSWLAHPAQQETKTTMKNLLPAKSKERYEINYERFAEWRSERKLNCLLESVFMDYFGELSKTLMPTSLWALYSMLKGTVLQRHNVNISSYNNLKSMLRTHAAGHQCKQSKVFTQRDMERFLIEAPDSEYLAAKVPSERLQRKTKVQRPKTSEILQVQSHSSLEQGQVIRAPNTLVIDCPPKKSPENEPPPCTKRTRLKVIKASVSDCSYQPKIGVPRNVE